MTSEIANGRHARDTAPPDVSRPASPPESVDDYRVDWGELILWVGLSIYAFVMARLVVARHNSFWSFDYDLGIFDQAVWLMSRGQSFMTVRGLEVFGHHASLAYYLLVPFYWLGAGPNFLNVLMVASVALSAVPIYRYGQKLLKNNWWALVPAAAFLMHFTNSWMINETFHPEVTAMAPFLAGYVAAANQRWRQYALWMILAVSWKEDIALAALVVGVILVIRGRHKPGWITIGASLAWFVFVTQVMIPFFSNGGVFYDNFYGNLGVGPVEVIRTTVTDPTLVTGTLLEHDFGGYLRDLLFPFGFLPLLSPLTLLIGLPQVLANLLTVVSWTANLRVHYAALPLAVAGLAMVEGLARLRSASWQRFALGVIAAATVGAGAAWSLFPFGASFDQGYWPLYGNDRQSVLRQAISLPSPGDSVTATYNLVPHLTHRSLIYTWPNPWITLHWGTGVEEPPDPSTVHWLVIDRQILGDSAPEFDRVLAEESWEIVFDQQSVLVAHRSSP